MSGRSLTIPLRWRRLTGLALVMLAAPAAAAFRFVHQQRLMAGAALLIVLALWTAALRARPRGLVALLLGGALDVLLLLRGYARLPDGESPWLGAGLWVPIVYLLGLGLLLGSAGYRRGPRAPLLPPGA